MIVRTSRRLCSRSSSPAGSTPLSAEGVRKPELAAAPLPLEARIAAVPCRVGEGFLRALLEPLEYQVEATRHELDESMPALGRSRLFTVTLRSTRRLSELLTHLYVLIPVRDDQKHYWVGEDEVEKLLRHGEGWLDKHPSRDVIVSRYLAPGARARSTGTPSAGQGS
jgi:Hen1-like subunit of RNA repair complex